MSGITPNLNLVTYNTITDASSILAFDYINQVSGSGTNANLISIDNFAGGVNTSLSSISASMTGYSASIVFSSACQVSTGSATVAIVSPYGLSHSNYGQHTAIITLNSIYALTGTETDYIRIPLPMNGWILSSVAAACGALNGSGSSTSGSPTFLLQRTSASSMSPVNMLSNVITIDQGEFDSSTSASPVVISTTASSIWTGDKIWGRVSASGTGVLGAKISLTFQNYP
jgi:hypothetical protein